MEFKDRLKTHLLESGAWDRHAHTKINAFSKVNMGNRMNFKQHPFQYILNPFVAGPLRHLGTEAYVAIMSMMYTLIKSGKSESIKSASDFKTEVNKIHGAWDRYKSTMFDFLDSNEKNLNKMKGENFFQYMLNPFVDGPITEKFGSFLKDNIHESLLKYAGDKTTPTKGLTPDQRKLALDELKLRKALK